MIITCEKCSSKFNLDEKLLKQTGSKVRCSKCKNVFTAYPPLELKDPDLSIEEIIQPEETVSEIEMPDIEMPDIEISDSENKEESVNQDTSNTAEDIDLPGLDNLSEKLELELEEFEPEKPEPEQPVLEQPVLEQPVLEQPVLAQTEIEHPAPEQPEPVKPEIEKPEPDFPDNGLKETHEAEINTDEKFRKIPKTGEIGQEDLDLYDIEKMFVEDEKNRASFKQESPDSHDLELEDIPEFKNRFSEKSEKNKNTFNENESAVKSVAEPSKTEFSETSVDQPEESRRDKSKEPEPEPEKTPIINNNEKTELTKKKSVSTPTLIILIITLLAGGLYGGYVILKNLNIKVPFVSSSVAPDVSDQGDLKINIFEVSDKFIENSGTKMLIVYGKVKNEYSQARGFIRVTGKLYADGKNLLKSKSVYCGNIIPENNLTTMEPDLIEKKLASPMGDNKSNVKLNPGESLRFMMVFPDISDKIEEYTVQVLSSLPA
jgi:predicted Zn finger-like uncharacterized protein